jgi:cytosine deaminase
VELQVVAFPQDGVVREPEAEAYVRQALEMGADVTGGIPWIEFTRADEQAHIDKMFDLTCKYNKDISMLLDDVGDPEEKTLEMFALRAIKEGWQGRATAQHCRAMALYEENYFRKLTALLKKAGIGIVADPHTGPLHARVRDLAAAGIPVALGQDDIADAYYPFGRCNKLEIAFLASHLMWMTSLNDMELLYDMITTSAAKVLGIRGHELMVGGNADLVVLEAADVYHAIWDHRAPLHVIKDGKEVSSSQ